MYTMIIKNDFQVENCSGFRNNNLPENSAKITYIKHKSRVELWQLQLVLEPLCTVVGSQ